MAKLFIPLPLRRLLALCWLACAMFSPAGAAGANEERQVLILYSLGSDSVSTWQKLVHKGLYDELGRRNLGSTPAIFEERFDANLVGEAQALEGMAPYLRTKYAAVKFDAIITENAVAAAFLAAHPELFPGVPRHYVNHGQLGWHPADGAGYEVRSDFARAIAVIPQVAPNVRRIAVVGDQSARCQEWVSAIRAVARSYSKRIAFEFWDNQTFEDLQRAVRGLDRGTALFLLMANRDSTGAIVAPGELARAVAASTQAPVFTHTESMVQSGVVGGYVVSGENVGRMIAQILLGEPPLQDRLQGYLFDYPTAQRFHLRNLPPDALLRNRPEDVWDLYRWQIIGGITLIVLQGVLITSLVLVLRDRRRTLGALADERNNLEDRVLQRTLELLMANQKLEQLATTDPLTGIANRRKMTEQIAHELERARRFRHPLSLLMIDIDHFKRINDTYGHDVGDKAILAVSKLLTVSMRSIDLAARFGGEEFVLLMPETHLQVAVHAAERLREAMATLRVEAEGGADVALTVSIGVSSADQLGAQDTPSTLLVRADKALYRAKKEGRNCVKTADQ
jgi:two-component system cell cycle response regulator